MLEAGPVRVRAQKLHADEQVGEAFDVWTDLRARRAAVLWVLKAVYVRVLEDKGLLSPGRLYDPEAWQLFERLAPNLGETAFLRWVYRDLASERGGLPELFGPITAANPIDLHGQGIDLGRLARSLDGDGLLLSHDFTNGFMNPLFQNSSAGAIVCGLVLSVVLLLAARGAPSDLRFYAVLNLINLFNPLAWIMGLVWYLPLFFSLYPSVSRLGRWLILLPLFLPPSLNANAALAYLVGILFLLAAREVHCLRVLLIADTPCQSD
jgi:hypothetical protein